MEVPLQEKIKEESTDNYFQVPQFEGDLNFKESLKLIKDLGTNSQDVARDIDRLHYLANLLLVSDMAFNEIKLAMEYDKGALATNQTASITGFEFVEDKSFNPEELRKKGLNITEVSSEVTSNDESKVRIASTRGKAALLRFMPLLSSNNLIKTFQNWRAVLETSSNDSDEEVVKIAVHVKNQLCQKCRTVTFLGTSLWLFHPLFCLERQPNLQEWRTVELFDDIKISCEMLQAKDCHASLCDWLKNKDALSTVQNTIPHTLWVYKLLNALTKYIKIEPVNRNVVLDSHTQLHFSEGINKLLQKLDPYFKKSNELYQVVMGARMSLLNSAKMKAGKRRIGYFRKTSIVFLNLTNKTSFLCLPTKLSVCGDHKEEVDFFVRPKEKKQSKKPSKKKHHKRHNKRRHNEDNLTIQKEELNSTKVLPSKEVKKISEEPSIKYDKRVSRWFEGTVVASEESYFYHNFGGRRRADEIMMQYGKKKIVPNKTNPRRMDTCYYMPGEVHYSDGRKRTVIYHCVVGFDGLIYHRGIDMPDDVLHIILTDAYEYNFPALYEDLDERQEAQIQQSNKDSDEFEEDGLCFYLKDNHNPSVNQIVLFKT